MSLTQDNLLFLSKKSLKRSQLSSIQHHLILSLLSRLRSVRDVYEELRLLEVNNSSFLFLSSKDKLRLALTLKTNRFASVSNTFYIEKTLGYSLFFKFVNIYDNCFLSLLNNACLPIVEEKSNKFSLINRPFRNYSDAFIHISSLFNKKKYSWYLKFQVIQKFNSSCNFWLFKNFPLEKKVLFYLLFNNYEPILCLENNKQLFRNDIYVTFLNYILNGLLRVLVNYFEILRYKLLFIINMYFFVLSIFMPIL